MNAVVEVRLGDVQRRAVRLVAALNGAGAEAVEVQAALRLDPVHRALVADEHLVRVELRAVSAMRGK